MEAAKRDSQGQINIHVEAWWWGRGDFDLKGRCREGCRCEGEEAGEGLDHCECRRRAEGCSSTRY